MTGILMRCDGGLDKVWAITSLTPNGKGPFVLRSQSAGLCLSNASKGVVLEECDANDVNDLFESLKVV